MLGSPAEAGLPRGTGQAGMLGTLLTLLPPSQFKESALRKQSLYLNFDPLLQDSPWALAPSRYAQPAARTGGGGGGSGAGLPRGLVSEPACSCVPTAEAGRLTGRGAHLS